MFIRTLTHRSLRSKAQTALACVTSALAFTAALAEPSLQPPEAAAHTAWSVGFARAAITPEKAMWMAGYAARDHRAEGRVHELFVRVCAIGEPAAVLITLDLIGIDRETSQRICRRLEERHGLTRDRVAINASHTHCGPVFGTTLPTMQDLSLEDLELIAAHTQRVEDRIVECVDAALADRRPARVSWGQGTCSVGVNRRENREAEIPAVRAAGRPLRGPFDHDVPVLAIHDEAGGIRAAIFGYACHATVLGFYQWCGDYPGFACLEWERRHPGAMAMFWSGCGGDQNPLPRRSVELAAHHGGKLADAVDAVLDEGALEPVAGRLDTRYVEVPLELSPIPDRSDWEKLAAGDARFERIRARHLLATLDRDGRIDDRYRHYPVQLWTLGSGGPRWIFLGGEVVVDYALRLKREFGRERTWIAGYSNDVMAYIPSRRVLAEGGYESDTSMVYYGLPAPWAPSIEETIVGAVRSVAVSAAEPVPPTTDAPPAARLRLPREKMLLYRDDSGAERTATTVDEWLRRRRTIVADMERVMGRLPGDEKRCPPDIQIEEETDCGTYVRRLITYLSEPGCRVPAYLLLPKAVLRDPAAKAPAVLCLHGTDDVVGHGVVVGLGPLDNRQYASELAERGYVTLAPNYPQLAKYRPDLARLGWQSGTLKAVWDNMAGVDLLDALPYVQRGEIGAIGHSLGGHNAIFTAVFDGRIKAVVSCCGFDSFLDYYGGDERVWLPGKGWTQTRYMPRLADYRGRLADIPFDFHELIAALAPRHVLIVAPWRDENFRAASVDGIAAAARPIYGLHDVPGNLMVEHPDCEHDFPPEMREQAYALFDAVLKK